MRMATTALSALGIVMATGGISACGSDNSAPRCPPEFPVERGGYCYAADGGAMADSGATSLDASGGGSDAGASDADAGVTDTDGGVADVDAGGTTGTDAGASDTDAAVACMGTHPLVMGTRRYCDAADCYCAATDACFGAGVAAACCSGAVTCAGDDAGTPPPTCMGTHPLVSSMMRYCNAGDCYCPGTDACFSTATAMACCAGTVTCY